MKRVKSSVKAASGEGDSKTVSMIESVLQDLTDEYGFEFSHPNYDSAEPSIEFMYGIPEWGDCAFYADMDTDPDLFDDINGDYLDEAFDLLRYAIINNYEQDYGPLDDMS